MASLVPDGAVVDFPMGGTGTLVYSLSDGYGSRRTDASPTLHTFAAAPVPMS